MVGPTVRFPARTEEPMNKPAHSVHVHRIPTLDEVEAAGAWEQPISLDSMVVDFARGSKDTRHVGEPWPVPRGLQHDHGAQPRSVVGRHQLDRRPDESLAERAPE